MRSFPTDAVAMTIDAIAMFAPRVAAADVAGELAGTELGVVATDLRRAWTLRIGDGVAFEPDADGAATSDARTGTLRLPGASLERLLAGRLDPATTPDGIESAGRPSLDDMRRLFPGF